jgi:hypothetical protein
MARLDETFEESEERKKKERLAAQPGNPLSLQSSIQNNIQPPQTISPEGVGPVADVNQYASMLETKSTPEIKQEAKKSIAETDNKAKEAQKAASRGEIPQSAADNFKEQRDRAYELYDRASTRNDWLELAQLLGQAVTQYGAAQVGMRTGRNLAGLNIPSVNYEARTAEAGRMLERRLRDVDTAETKQERSEAKEELNKYRQQELALKKQELGIKAAQDPYAKMEAAASLKQQEGLQKSLSEQLKAAQVVYSAQTALAGGDLSKKQREQAEGQIQRFAGPAGIDMMAIEEASKEPGMLWGTNVSEQKKVTNIGQVVAELQQKLQQLRQQSPQVRLPGKQTAQPSAPARQEAAPSDRMVTVTHKATGQSRQYPAGSPEVLRAQQDPDFEVK